MKSKAKVIFIIALIVIFISPVLKLLDLNISNLNLLIITSIGINLLAVTVFNFLKNKDGINKDELTRKIADRSAAYSWVITFFIIFIIYWLNYLEIVNFTINSVLIIIYFFMILSVLIFQNIFLKKGDF